MRIAICGTHGIGKTTLARALYRHAGAGMFGDESPFTEFLGESARFVAEDMEIDSLADIKYWPDDERNYFQWRIFVNQIAQETEYPAIGFVSDRSVIDNLAYCMYYQCPEDMVGAFYEFCRMHTKHYDMLYYLPIPAQLSESDTEDGFRMSDIKSMEEVDDIIAGLLNTTAVNCPVTVLSVNRPTWEAEVIESITELQGK